MRRVFLSKILWVSAVAVIVAGCEMSGSIVPSNLGSTADGVRGGIPRWATPTPTLPAGVTPMPTIAPLPTIAPTVTPTPGASTFTIGETNITSVVDSGNANLILGQRVTLAKTATVLSLSFYVDNPDGSLILGVYDSISSGGNPGALLAQTSSFIPVAGWNTQPVQSPIVLAAGDYWLTYLPSSNALTFRNSQTGTGVWSGALAGSMPSFFGSVTGGGSVHWSFYATLSAGGTLPTPGPTATPRPTATPGPTAIPTPTQIPVATPTAGPTPIPGSVYSLPSDRSTTWKPGVTYNGGIPNRTTVCATLTATGTTADRTADVNAAITNCPDGQVVSFGAGDFRISGTIYGKSGITLRGAGLDATSQQRTRLWKNYSLPYSPGAIIQTYGLGGEAGSTSLTANSAAGANYATVASVAGLSSGQMVLISQVTDDSLWRWGGWSIRDVVFLPSSVGRGWFTRQDRPTGQFAIIDHIAGNTVYFTTPLRLAYSTQFLAELTRYSAAPVTLFGIENLLIEGDPMYAQGNITAGGMIQFTGAYKSWIKNSEVRYTLDGGVRFDHALMCEAQHVYVHFASNPTPGGAGYLVQFDGYTSDSLLEDSILLYGNKLVVGRGTGPGNVIGYTYADDGFDDTNHAWSDFGLISTHLVGAHYTLFEGNEAPNGDGDDIWGNANWIVFFRNHMCGQRGCGRASAIPGETGPRRMLAAEWGNKYYSAVGNVLGLPGVNYAASGFMYEQTSGWSSPAIYTLGCSPDFSEDTGHPVLNSLGTRSGWDLAGDPAVLSTYLRVGNFDYLTNQQRTHGIGSASYVQGAPSPLPNSMYQPAKPAFFGSKVWPWVEPGGSTHLFSQPARARYDAGTPNATN